MSSVSSSPSFIAVGAPLHVSHPNNMNREIKTPPQAKGRSLESTMITPPSNSFVVVDVPPSLGIQDVKIHVGPTAPTAPRTQSLPLPSRPSVPKVAAVAEFTFESIAEHALPMLYPDKFMEQLHALDTEIVAITSTKRSFKNLLKGKANEVISLTVAAVQGFIASASSIPNSPDLLTTPGSSWFPATLGFVTGLVGTGLTRQSSVSESNQLEDLKGQRRRLLAELTSLYLEKSEAFITKYVNHTFKHTDLEITADDKLRPFIAAIQEEEDSLINREIASTMVKTAKKMYVRLPEYITRLKEELGITTQEATNIVAPLKDTTRLIELKDRVTREKLSNADIVLLNSMVATRDMDQAARDKQRKSLVERAQVRMTHETAISALRDQQTVADAASDIAFVTLDTEIENLKAGLKKTNEVASQQGRQTTLLSQKVDAGFLKVDASILQLQRETETKIADLKELLIKMTYRIDDLNHTILAQAREIATQDNTIKHLIESNQKRKKEIGGVKTEIAGVLHTAGTISHEIKKIKESQSRPVNLHSEVLNVQGDVVFRIGAPSSAPNEPSRSSSTPISLPRGPQDSQQSLVPSRR